MIQVISGSYLEYVDKGRKPGKQPPQSAIKKWIDIRGISPDKGMTKDGLAFVIARSIGRKGIQPTGVIKKSMANVMKSKEILSKAAGKDVEKYIKNILINI